MAVNLSPYGGVGAQFLDNSGNVLTGGKIFTYAAGTTTNQTTYTTSAGNIPHSNPIILDASGRVPSGGEIWLTDGSAYKFILRDSNDVLIATYDNVTGINSNFVAFTNQQEIQTATAGQTVFNLTTMTYPPGTNSLSVFVDGVNQYGPGAQYAYLETDNDTITFVNGLHVGAEVKFTTSQLNSSGLQANAFQISYTPPFTGSTSTNVGDKLAQTVSVMDFGAVGDGTTDDTAAIQAAINSGVKNINFPSGSYAITDIETTVAGQTWYFDGGASLKAIASTSTKSLVLVKRGNCTFYNMLLNGNYNLNYTSLLNIQAESGFNAPQYLSFNNLILQSSKIGILYGDTTPPLNAPVSENHIIGGYTRDIHRIIYSNQPNGFLFVTNFTFDNQIYDWLGTATYPTYASWYTTSAAIENNEGWFSLVNCEIVKAQSDEGAVFVNADHIKIVGSICEAACSHFWAFVGTSVTTPTYYVDSYTCNVFNNAVSAFIEIYAPTGYFEGTNIEYARNINGPSLYPVGFVNTFTRTGWVFKFTNCRFINQNIPSLFQSSYPGVAATNSLCSFFFKNCEVTNTTTGLSMPLSMSDNNLAWYYNALDIAKFNTSTTGGSALATVANVTLTGYFTKVLRLTGDTGQSCVAVTKVAIDQTIQGQKRIQVLEFWQRTTSNNFNGLLEVITYDGTTLLGSIDLSNGAGAVANIPLNSGAPVDWKKVQFVLPRSTFNVTEIAIRFTAQSVAQVWEIGNISVY